MQSNVIQKNNIPQDHHEPFSYLDDTGWFFVAQKIEKTGYFFHTPYPVSKKPEILNLLFQQQKPDRNYYLSQGEFWSADSRTVDNCKSISDLFVDIDLAKHKIAVDEKSKELIKEFAKNVGLPPFSEISDTGGGFHVKFFHEAVSDINSWRECEDLLVDLFLYGFRPNGKTVVDSGVRDAARVLRQPGTFNPSAGRCCEITETGPSYKFEDLKNILFSMKNKIKALQSSINAEETEKNITTPTAQGTPIVGVFAKPKLRIVPTKYSKTFWHWRYVLNDVLTLADIRYQKEIQEGEGLDALNRDMFTLISGVALGHCYKEDGAAWLATLNDIRLRLAPTWDEKKFRNHICTLIKKFNKDANGETKTYNGKEYCHLYTYSTEKIISVLGITQNEMFYMHTLADENYKAERRKEQIKKAGETYRRKNEVEEREEYIERAEKKRSDALFYARNGRSTQQIAELIAEKYNCSISLRTVQHYLSEPRETPSVERTQTERKVVHQQTERAFTDIEISRASRESNSKSNLICIEDRREEIVEQRVLADFNQIVKESKRVNPVAAILEMLEQPQTAKPEISAFELSVLTACDIFGCDPSTVEYHHITEPKEPENIRTAREAFFAFGDIPATAKLDEGFVKNFPKTNENFDIPSTSPRLKPTEKVIMHVCGHEQIHDLAKCPAEKRESRIKWLATTQCSECWKKANAAAAKDFEKELGLPELTGTEKTIKWGRQIRIDFVKKELETSTKEAVIALCIKQNRAKFWIDNRYKLKEKLILETPANSAKTGSVEKLDKNYMSALLQTFENTESTEKSEMQLKEEKDYAEWFEVWGDTTATDENNMATLEPNGFNGTVIYCDVPF